MSTVKVKSNIILLQIKEVKIASPHYHSWSMDWTSPDFLPLLKAGQIFVQRKSTQNSSPKASGASPSEAFEFHLIQERISDMFQSTHFCYILTSSWRFALHRKRNRFLKSCYRLISPYKDHPIISSSWNPDQKTGIFGSEISLPFWEDLFW